MKKTLLEKKLEDYELDRLVQLEIVGDTDLQKRAQLMSDIERIHKMRDTLEAHRVDNKNSWMKTLIQTGVPVFATLVLAFVGYMSEQSVGNPSGFTLKWLIGRTPR